MAKSGAEWGVVEEKTSRFRSIRSPLRLVTMSSTPNSNPIFSGEFRHALDSKKRVTVPARWRSSDADEFYLIEDRSRTFLKVMPPAQFKSVGEKAMENAAISPSDRAKFLRLFYSRAIQVVADKQGRMLVPENYGKPLGLEGEVVLVGAYETFEIWNAKTWEANKERESATYDQVAELLGL